jgi:hypothetical protein
MTRDLKTTIIGAILAGIAAVQPAINAFSGKFELHDGVQLAMGFLAAALGYYIGKVDPPAQP